MRTHSAAAYLKNSQGAWPYIGLKATINEKEKLTEVYFIPGTTTDVDEGYDAGLFNSGNGETGIYTHIEGSDLDFGIQSVSESDMKMSEIAVGLNAPAGSTVTFTTEVSNLPEQVNVYLLDKLSGTYTLLGKTGGSYTITSTTQSSGIGRFYLVTTTQPYGIKEQNGETFTVVPLPSENRIRIIGKIAAGTKGNILDVNGRILRTFSVNDQGENSIPFVSASGMYFIQIQTGTKVYTRKVNWVR